MSFSKRAIKLAMVASGAAMVFAATSAIAQDAEHPTQRVIVKWKTPQKTAQQAATAARTMSDMQARYGVQLSALRTLATGAEVIALGRSFTRAELGDLITTLSADPNVEYVEEDRMMQALFTPNDPRYNEQHHYFESAGGINLPAAWELSTGTGVRVAVLDTGYRPHVDLNANILPGYDFISDTFVANDGSGRDTSALDPGDFYAAGACGAGQPAKVSGWHGTHVAGTIGALTNNGIGVAGVAFNAKIVPVRVLGRCGGLTSDIADAIVWASGGTVSGAPTNPNPARVINMSLGGSGPCDTTTQNAINSARSRGTVIVVAAGNDNGSSLNQSPANCAGVITVAALNRNGGRAFYSNTGSNVDIAAPGGAQNTPTDPNGVLSTMNSGTSTPVADSYGLKDGTSMATPHVAGTIALMLSRNSALTPTQVETLLKSSARPFPATCNACGAGKLDALAAVNAAIAAGGGGNTGNVLRNGVPITGLSGATGSEQRFTFTVPAGASNLSLQISGGSGDADMYIRIGAQPTTTAYDCRPFLSGNNETCTDATPVAGSYEILIRGFAAYSGLTLSGRFTSAAGTEE